MKLHPLTLKFSGESSDLEEPFQNDYYEASLFQMRIMMILGAILYAAFGMLDAVLMPEQKVSIWLIRVIIIGPVLVFFLLLSFTLFFKKFMQPLIALAYFVSGAGIIFMIVIALLQITFRGNQFD